MADLYPTKTRLALLADVGRGRVLRYPNGETRQYFEDGTYTVVNARVGELAQAGWVSVGAEVAQRWRTISIGRTTVLACGSSPGRERRFSRQRRPALVLRRLP